MSWVRHAIDRMREAAREHSRREIEQVRQEMLAEAEQDFLLAGYLEDDARQRAVDAVEIVAWSRADIPGAVNAIIGTESSGRTVEELKQVLSTSEAAMDPLDVTRKWMREVSRDRSD